MSNYFAPVGPITINLTDDAGARCPTCGGKISGNCALIFRALKALRGLTYEDIAKEMGVTRQRIQQIANSKSVIRKSSMDRVLAVAAKFDVTVTFSGNGQDLSEILDDAE